METVNIQQILDEIKVPPKYKAIYDKMVFNGKRLMFSKDMEKSLNAQLDGPGDLAGKIAKGVVAVMYMMWNASNKTLPVEMMVPVTFTLTVEAFAFLQKAQDPDATKEVLGNAVEQATELVMQGFKVAPDKIKEFVDQNQSAVKDAGSQIEATSPPAGAAPPQPSPPAGGGGMITQGVPNG